MTIDNITRSPETLADGSPVFEGTSVPVEKICAAR